LKKTVKTESRRGKLHALDFQQFLERNDFDDIDEFIREYRISSPGHQRRFVRFMLKMVASLQEQKQITTQNDDVVNICKHIHMICGGLPLRD